MSSRRDQWLSLVAMTLASSMILVDQTAVPLASPDVVLDLSGNLTGGQWILTANILPLAACLVLGGRVADVVGLRRAFVVGGVVFAVATILAGAAPTYPWMIGARVLQGLAAAVMMPTSVAITSAVWPKVRRGYALGILAGASAFFAAIGPVLGGVLAAVNWRLVFLINVPLAVGAVVLALISTPPLDRKDSGPARLDWVGGALFAAAMVGLVYGLAQGQPEGWTSWATLLPLSAAVLFAGLFVLAERRAVQPLIDASLFGHRNFTASTVSQLIAGMIELGLGYLLPFYLLLVVGVGPVTAGLVLIPGTVPIILAGPLAGRLFDRIGGRWPLTLGFVVLAASGVALGVGVAGESAVALMPGLVLQGIGLGVVLTVNDPVGMNAIDDSEQGQAAGIINTAEQVGGAIGIAILSAIQLSYYLDRLYERLAAERIVPTAAEVEQVHVYLAQAEQFGLRNVPTTPVVRAVYNDLIQAHAQSFQVIFYVSAALALIGAVASAALVRSVPVAVAGRVFSRRSRWVLANAGATTPALTRRPPPVDR